jgi:hypothetical protein
MEHVVFGEMMVMGDLIGDSNINDKVVLNHLMKHQRIRVRITLDESVVVVALSMLKNK